jgi:hypothetical protein
MIVMAQSGADAAVAEDVLAWCKSDRCREIVVTNSAVLSTGSETIYCTQAEFNRF